MRACGVAAPVRSPTYTLVQAYECGDLDVVHLDLYRLRDPAELEHLGLAEWADPGHLWLIEWPERGEGVLPRADLTVALTAGATAHEALITAGSVAGEAWLARLQTGIAVPPS